MCLETVRVSGILLQPVIPNLSDRLLNRLGIPKDKRTLAHAKKPYLNSPTQLPLGPNEGILMKRFKMVTPDNPLLQTTRLQKHGKSL